MPCRLLSLLVVVLAGCPMPIEETCERLLVGADGNVNQGFGGAGGGPGNAEPPLGIAGTPLTVTLFAPLTACVSDTLRVDAKLLDPDNLPITAFTATEPTRIGIQGVVTTSLLFTPTRPGIHTLQLSFEPSIGVRSLLINVAADGLLGATTRVPLPPGRSCPGNLVWPLSSDTVACEEQRTGFISLSSADGGVSRFAGSQLVVADNVLWSINGNSSTLERRLYVDGGAQVTHSFPNFPPSETPAMHDVGLAMRFRSSGRLAVIRVQPDGGTSTQETALDGQVGTPLAYFVEDNGVVYRWSNLDCSFANCINLLDLTGLEPGMVWRNFNSGFEASTRTSGFTRPTTQSESAPRFTLQHATESSVSPGASFERLPIWLNAPIGGQRLLVSVENGALTFTAWPRSQVFRVGRHHLLLSDPALTFVRVVQK